MTPSRILQCHGDLVFKARINYGLTLPNLAKKSKVAQGTLSKIENGTNNSCLLTIVRLAEALGVPANKLIP